LFAPLALGACAYPQNRYYSAPCAPNAAGAQQVAPGTDGKQCVYAAPDYAGVTSGPQGPYPYAAGEPYPYGPGVGYNAFDDGWGYSWDDPYFALGFGGVYGAYGHGWRHGSHGGWGGYHGGGGFHGGGVAHGGGGGGHGR
jgi:hypothetical protein